MAGQKTTRSIIMKDLVVDARHVSVAQHSPRIGQDKVHNEAGAGRGPGMTRLDGTRSTAQFLEVWNQIYLCTTVY